MAGPSDVDWLISSHVSAEAINGHETIAPATTPAITRNRPFFILLLLSNTVRICGGGYRAPYVSVSVLEGMTAVHLFSSSLLRQGVGQICWKWSSGDGPGFA
ncbi:MAG: hypothetical protein AAB393_01530, partial [Bacteroidota bacterium]